MTLHRETPCGFAAAGRCKPFPFTGLSVAMLATGLMGLANDMVGDTAGAAELFTYFGLIAIASIVVRQLAPYRSLGWFSGDDTPVTEGRN